MVAERSAADAAQLLADALGAAEIPYAIGGALALAIAGVPRGTADVDINVFGTRACAAGTTSFRSTSQHHRAR